MLTVFVVLAAILIVIGYEDRHEAGWLPFILGVFWALFTLACIGQAVKGEEEDH
jgi:hypothetical protein